MKTNALAIGVSSFEYINILLSYYPRELNEDFDIYIFVDSSKIKINDIKKLINSHNIKIWNNATLLDIKIINKHYADLYNITGKAKYMLHDHGCIFKLYAPIYLIDTFGCEKVLTSDDDVFIFKDLSPIFNTYKEFAFKKDTLFTFKTSKKYKILNGFNKIFNTDFSVERMDSLPVNAGNILSSRDDSMHLYFYNFLTSDVVHDMYYNHKGYISWTIEQRFQHFNLHRLQEEKRGVELFKAEDLKLLLAVGKNHPQKHLALKTPRLLHYAVGKKKLKFLREFLPRIEWKYGFNYETKYELKNKIFIENKLF